MPDSLDEYLQTQLNLAAACILVRSSDVQLDKRTIHSGVLRGDLYFLDGSRLHFRELIDTQVAITRLMYSYHYQKEDGSLIFRYDDTPHHPGIAGFPHHKHSHREDNVEPASAPFLKSINEEITEHYNG